MQLHMIKECIWFIIKFEPQIFWLARILRRKDKSELAYLSYFHSVSICWSRVTHICVSKLTIIGWDNGFSPGRYRAIIWTNAGLLLFRSLGANFSEILSKIHTFSYKKMHLKMSSAKWWQFCLYLNVLIYKGMTDVCTDGLGQWNPLLFSNKLPDPVWVVITIYPWWRHQMDFFRVTGHLCGEFTGPRWIPRTKASDAELWCFLWSAPE